MRRREYSSYQRLKSADFDTHRQSWFQKSSLPAVPTVSSSPARITSHLMTDATEKIFAQRKAGFLVGDSVKMRQSIISVLDQRSSVLRIASASSFTPSLNHSTPTNAFCRRCFQTSATSHHTGPSSLQSDEFGEPVVKKGVDGTVIVDSESTQPPPPSLLQLPGLYVELSKARLTGLVVLSTMAGYALAPMPMNTPTLIATVVGTTLCAASANTFNQWWETDLDAKMTRTRNRVMPRKALSTSHVLGFATASGVIGVGLLFAEVNTIAAALGLANIVLYAGVYTPMKQTHIANTWVGALVGAIPPLMGWVACSGTLFSAHDVGAWALAGVLFAWQFPHFNGLSWGLRKDYERAGHKMMCVSHVSLCQKTSLRYALALFPLSYALTLFGHTTEWFLLDSTLVNGFFLYRSYQFYQDSNDSTAKRLFVVSVLHLPILIALMLLHKEDCDHHDHHSMFFKQ